MPYSSILTIQTFFINFFTYKKNIDCILSVTHRQYIAYIKTLGHKILSVYRFTK